MTENQKIAFIGEREYSKAMRFVGFECFGVLDRQEADDLIEKLKKENYALILVSEDVAPLEVGLGNVVILPGMVQKPGSEFLKKEIIKAVGGEINLSVNA